MGDRKREAIAMDSEALKALRTRNLSPLRRRFFEYLVGERNLSLMTACTYENSLRCLERFLDKPAEGADSDDLRRFIRESPLHPTTKNGVMVGMKAFHRWGVLEKEWPLSSIAEVPGPKLIHNPKECLTTAEAATLLQVVRRPNEARLLCLGLYGGLRVGEMVRIDAESWRDDRLRFVGKGRKTREVPVLPELAAKRDLILSRTSSDSALKQVVRTLVYLTGIQFSSHTLRRTFATHLSEDGVPREVVGALLGHAPASTTEIYAPVRWTEKLDAMDMLSYEREGTR
jgi:site-specific recombinase XerD